MTVFVNVFDTPELSMSVCGRVSMGGWDPDVAGGETDGRWGRRGTGVLRMPPRGSWARVVLLPGGGGLASLRPWFLFLLVV